MWNIQNVKGITGKVKYAISKKLNSNQLFSAELVNFYTLRYHDQNQDHSCSTENAGIILEILALVSLLQWLC